MSEQSRNHAAKQYETAIDECGRTLFSGSCRTTSHYGIRIRHHNPLIYCNAPAAKKAATGVTIMDRKHNASPARDNTSE